MGRRLLPVALVLAAGAADARGLRELAFYLLVAAVPAGAVCALDLFGDLVELPGGAFGETATRVQTALAGVGLLLLLLAAAVRGQASGSDVPPLAASALVACIAVFGVQAVTSIVAPPSRRREAAGRLEA